MSTLILLRNGLFPCLVPFAFFELFCPIFTVRKAVIGKKKSLVVRNSRCVVAGCYKNCLTTRMRSAIRELSRSKRERPPCLVTCHVASEAIFCRFITHNSLHRLICRFLIQKSLYNITTSIVSRTVVADMLSFTFSLFPPFLSFLRFFACLYYLGGTDLPYRITFCVTNKCF